MFLHLLDRDQRRELCRAAQLVAQADAVTDLREEVELERLRRESGFDPLPPTPADIDALLPGLHVVDDAEARHVFMVELLRVGLADGGVDDAELEVVAAVCRRLDITKSAFARCRDLARRVRDLDDDGRDLFTALAEAQG